MSTEHQIPGDFVVTDEVRNGIVVEHDVLISEPMNTVWRAVKRAMWHEQQAADQAAHQSATRDEGYGPLGIMQMRIIECNETLMVFRTQVASFALDDLTAETLFCVRPAGDEASYLVVASYSPASAEIHAVKRILRHMSHLSIASIQNYLGTMDEAEYRGTEVAPESDFG